MKSGLNFDEIALKAKTELIEKHGREWRLRGDVPSNVMIERFLLKDLGERFKGVIDAMKVEDPDGTRYTPDELRRRLEAEVSGYQADVLAICTAIFRHTLPETKAEEIAVLFNPDEQKAIVDHFFTLRIGSSSQPESAGAASSDAPPAEPNRAARRSRAKTAKAKH
ncbi:MAG TPA: hypothetical protein VFU72_09230 [Nitrolancea sp.]|nr:hypothetical protein [Nitrolancea sp.]